MCKRHGGTGTLPNHIIEIFSHVFLFQALRTAKELFRGIEAVKKKQRNIWGDGEVCVYRYESSPITGNTAGHLFCTLFTDAVANLDYIRAASNDRMEANGKESICSLI
jgi:hypothetical protein